MSKFWMVTEDPDYDEDGQLIDEDHNEGDWEELETYDPFETVNS